MYLYILSISIYIYTLYIYICVLYICVCVPLKNGWPKMFSGLLRCPPSARFLSQGTISQVQKHKVIQPMINKNGTSSSGVSSSFFSFDWYCENDLDRIQSHWEWFPHDKITWHPATINHQSYILGVSSCRCTVCIRMHRLASILGVLKCWGKWPSNNADNNSQW